MKKMIVALLLAFPLVVSVAPAARAEFDVYGSVAGYNWREADPAIGTRESGPIYGLGVMARLSPPAPNIITLTGRAEGFGGNLDFEDSIGKATTDLTGVKLEGDLGMKLRLPPGVSLEPFAGIGYRWWNRSVLGNDETWQNVYGRVGLRLEQHFPMTPVKIFAEGGAKIAISNRTSFDDGISTVYANPGKKTAAFAEAGVRVLPVKVSVFYEGLRFGSTDVPGLAIPDVSADIVGVRFGLSFF